MKLPDDFEGFHVCLIIAFICLTVFLVYLVGSIKEHNIKETEAFVNAGCEYTFLPGKEARVWTNCKCKKE